MLVQMMRRLQRGSGTPAGCLAVARGITLVEALVVVAIGAILVSLAAPSFSDLIARKRLEGMAAELATDLQFARSEAVQRGQLVSVTSSAAGCYVVHTLGVGSCSCTVGSAPTCTAPAQSLKSADAATGVTLPGKVFTFEPVRGMSSSTSDATDYFELSSRAGAWRLRAEINPLGRVRTCIAAGSFSGYETC